MGVDIVLVGPPGSAGYCSGKCNPAASGTCVSDYDSGGKNFCAFESLFFNCVRIPSPRMASHVSPCMASARELHTADPHNRTQTHIGICRVPQNLPKRSTQPLLSGQLFPPEGHVY